MDGSSKCPCKVPFPDQPQHPGSPQTRRPSGKTGPVHRATHGASYPDREIFLTALAELEVPPRAPLETDVILRYSAMDQLTISAETFSSDQVSRESIFQGKCAGGKIPREKHPVLYGKIYGCW